MQLTWAKDFRESFERTDRKLKVLAEVAELRTYVAARRANNKKVKALPHMHLAKRCQTQGLTLYEWKIDGQARLVFARGEGDLVLIDFSAGFAHDCVERLEKLKPSEAQSLLSSAEEFPAELLTRFLSTGLSNRVKDELESGQNEGSDRTLYKEEKSADWILFLDAEQLKVAKDIFDQLASARGFIPLALLGGAGTGKTMILADLATRIYLEFGTSARVTIPNGVREHLRIEDIPLPGNSVRPDAEFFANLVDDPMSMADLEKEFTLAQVAGVPFLFAVDPIQLSQRHSLSALSRFIKSNNFEVYSVSINYRQGRGAGEPTLAALRAFREASMENVDPLREQQERRKHGWLEEISLNEVRFAEDAGGFVVFEQEDFSYRNIIDEILRACEYRASRKWPKLLIGTPSKHQLPAGVPELLELFGDLDPEFRYRIRGFDQYKEVRGTEHDFVLLFVKSSSWQRLVDGVRVSRGDDVEGVNIPLHFLSRASNRAVVMVMPDDFPLVGLQTDVIQIHSDAARNEFRAWLGATT